jgi:Family of unknown function (DUF5694)
VNRLREYSSGDQRNLGRSLEDHVRIPLRQLLACLVLVSSAHAQERVDLVRERALSDRPALLIVGTAHFANPGRDIVNHQVEDVLSAKRQTEMEAVVEQLAAFKPTHVAVEWPADRQDALDARYQAYRDGKYMLSRNEIDQIGLRLAATLKLPHVSAIDWNKESPGDQSAYGSSSARATGKSRCYPPSLTPRESLATCR